MRGVRQGFRTIDAGPDLIVRPAGSDLAAARRRHRTHRAAGIGIGRRVRSNRGLAFDGSPADLVRPDLEARGLHVFEISAASHEGLRPLTFALAALVERFRAETAAVPPTRTVLRPKAVDDAGFTVTRREESGRVYFQVLGTRPERWVRQTLFSNDEAVGYLADRLARLGVEEALFAKGAVAGDEVVIGASDNAVVFDWEPTMLTGSELLGGPRGTDLRLENHSRPTRLDKRKEYKDRMDAKAEARAELWTERKAGVWTDDDPTGTSQGS